MFEKIGLSKRVDEKTYRRTTGGVEEKLGLLQRECKDAGASVVLVFEGVGAAGKGVQINRLIRALDSRGSDVYACDRPTEDEQIWPFLWHYWTKTPTKGGVTILDRSWCRNVQVDRSDDLTREDKLGGAYQGILPSEKQLCNDGAVTMKFLLYIDKDEQKKRLKKLEGSKETSWRVMEEDWNRNKDFDRYLKMNEGMLERTDTDHAPWVTIKTVDKDYAALRIVSTVMDRLEYELEHHGPEDEKTAQRQKSEIRERFKNSVLSGISLSKSPAEEEYETRLKELRKRLAELRSELHRLRILVVIGLEGWDVGGKGGVIKCLTDNLDPRGYRVNPTVAPNGVEKVHHYLWRLWNSVPEAGHIAIPDRTWYGRITVERIEGSCSGAEWRRTYQGINEVEPHMANVGAMVLKFWLHIDKDGQKRRFRERQANPAEQWKTTDKDWRNHEKWDQYEEAVNGMLICTSTTYAPRIVVEGNDKRHARVKVLQTVVDILEKKVREVKTDE